jgi:hypothetical protein
MNNLKIKRFKDLKINFSIFKFLNLSMRKLSCLT